MNYKNISTKSISRRYCYGNLMAISSYMFGMGRSKYKCELVVHSSCKIHCYESNFILVPSAVSGLSVFLIQDCKEKMHFLFQFEH